MVIRSLAPIGPIPPSRSQTDRLRREKFKQKNKNKKDKEK
jgi:hypothetical protein